MFFQQWKQTRASFCLCSSLCFNNCSELKISPSNYPLRRKSRVPGAAVVDPWMPSTKVLEHVRPDASRTSPSLWSPPKFLAVSARSVLPSSASYKERWPGVSRVGRNDHGGFSMAINIKIFKVLFFLLLSPIQCTYFCVCCTDGAARIFTANSSLVSLVTSHLIPGLLQAIGRESAHGRVPKRIAELKIFGQKRGITEKSYQRHRWGKHGYKSDVWEKGDKLLDCPVGFRAVCTTWGLRKLNI